MVLAAVSHVMAIWHSLFLPSTEKTKLLHLNNLLDTQPGKVVKLTVVRQCVLLVSLHAMACVKRFNTFVHSTLIFGYDETHRCQLSTQVYCRDV